MNERIENTRKQQRFSCFLTVKMFHACWLLTKKEEHYVTYLNSSFAPKEKPVAVHLFRTTKESVGKLEISKETRDWEREHRAKK